MKPYEFNGVMYNDLDSLAQAYVEDFKGGMDDIYTNTKLLLKFVKQVTKNKKIVNEVVSILTYTKYKNNALTFIIYLFLDDKKVYINGKQFTMREFIDALKVHTNYDNILFAFMEDYGISKTFANEDDCQEFAADAFFIEKNFKDPFTYKYLTTYYDYQIIESLNARISTVAVNGEECFRRATKVARNEDFQLGIAHKLGFRAAVEMHNEVNPIFKAVKLLKEKKETEEEYLKKIITDTFYWWLLDNLDKYTILKKKEAKPTFKRLYELKKEFKKYQDMILDKKITDISLDYLADISRAIYLNYLNFVTLFRNGAIIVKPRFSEAAYSFDKPYCKTYITSDFMKNHIVKLYNPNKEAKKVITVNPLTGKEIINDEVKSEDIDVDDISDDKPVLIKIDNENLLEEIKKSKKVLKKNSRFALYSSITVIVNTILILALAVAASLLFGREFNIPNLDLNTPINIINGLKIFIFALIAVAAIVNMILTFILSNLSADTLKDVNTLEFINNAKTKEKISPKQEANIIYLLTTEDKYKDSTKKKYKGLRLIVAVTQALTVSLLTILLCVLLKSVTHLVKYDGNTKAFLLAAFIGPLASSILVLVKKRNGFISFLIIDAIAFAVAALFMFLGV